MTNKKNYKLHSAFIFLHVYFMLSELIFSWFILLKIAEVFYLNMSHSIIYLR